MKFAIPTLASAILIAVSIISFTEPARAQDNAFIAFVKKRIKEEAKQTNAKLTLPSVCAIERDELALRVFREYGAMFVAKSDVRLPTLCIFRTPADVDAFQRSLETKKHTFGAVEIELQEEAMESLIEAKEEAARLRLKITPLDGAIAGRRDYADTVRIWNSRFYRALNYWQRRSRISLLEATDARLATVAEQIKLVVEWESKRIFFSTDFSKSIFLSVAPPGTSQHLSLLAFDVVEAGNPAVRRILNKHGWFQTIRTDQPHFTYLGVDESDLPQRGLKNVIHQGNSYWIPNTD